MRKILMEALKVRGSQTALANALGVGTSTVQHWAKGQTVPEAHRWGAIEKALGLAPMTLAKAAGVTLPADPDRYAALEAEVRRQGDELRLLRALVEQALVPPEAATPPAPERSQLTSKRGRR